MATTRPRSAEDAPSRKWTLGDQVYEQVLDMIVTGRFPENSRLPPEADLSQELGVSRPVLRQALERLRRDGLISSRKGSGSFVRRKPVAGGPAFAPVDSIADIRRCFEFRLAVEGEAAGLAAVRRTKQGLAQIKEALERLDDCIHTGELGTDADEAFHLAICEATDNRFFATARVSMQAHIIFGMNLARRLSLTHPVGRLELVQREHVDIYDAIARRDAEQACEAMRTHIDNARVRVFEGYDSGAMPIPSEGKPQ